MDSHYKKITEVGRILNEAEFHEDSNEISYLKAIRVIFKRPKFVFSMLAISALFFVVTGVQFWISDYMIVVLDVEPSYVFSMFAFVSITAPTTGVAIGGKISENLGGYTGKHALDYCLIGSLFAVLFSFPIPFLDNFWYVSLFLWLIFFIGGALLPTLTGLMLSSIPKHLRSIGSSVAQFIQNMTGYLPAPVLYGYIIAKTGGGKSRWGMILLMSWSIFGFISLMIAKIIEKARRDRHGMKEEVMKELKERQSGAEKSKDILGDIEIGTYERKPSEVSKYKVKGLKVDMGNRGIKLAR